MSPDTTDSFADIFSRAQKTPEFWEQMKVIEFTELVAARMEQTKTTQIELAKRIDVSPARVTKLLSGTNNFTVRLMAKVAHALGADLHFELRERDMSAQWRSYGAATVAVASVPNVISGSKKPSLAVTAPDHDQLALAA